MSVSRKCQYALRAVFELAKRRGEGPVNAAHIASAQAIPARFLELILGQLRKGGFVQSRRGIRGGYMLIADPRSLSVGQVMEFVDGPVTPVQCLTEEGKSSCPFRSGCAFMDMWYRAAEAIGDVYNNTTFQDLIDQEVAAGGYVAGYSI